MIGFFIITCIGFPIGSTSFRELPGCRNVPPNKTYWQIAADTEIGSVPGSIGAWGRCHPAAEPHACPVCPVLSQYHGGCKPSHSLLGIDSASIFPSAGEFHSIYTFIGAYYVSLVACCWLAQCSHTGGYSGKESEMLVVT